MIRCLIPDLPDAAALTPWLVRIDHNRWYTNSGPLACEFEQRLLGFIDGGAPASCVLLSSATSALELGLRALGVGAGARVLVPALTFPATALAVMRCGAVPVFSDVCPNRWMLTPAIARDALARGRFDLVMPVATFGLPLVHSEWQEFADDTKTAVLVDAAGALGLQALGRRVQWVFSLHATKPMGIGEGGLFVSFDAELVDRVRRLANFGFDKGIVRQAGTNAKLSEYAAAVGLAQLERWPQLLARRKVILEQYQTRLSGLRAVRMQSDRSIPPAMLCVQVSADAGAVCEALARSDIETRRWYLPPLYEHPVFSDFPRVGPDGSARLPATERLAATLIGLPFHTRLTSDDVARVVTVLGAELARLNATGRV